MRFPPLAREQPFFFFRVSQKEKMHLIPYARPGPLGSMGFLSCTSVNASGKVCSEPLSRWPCGHRRPISLGVLRTFSEQGQELNVRV